MSEHQEQESYVVGMKQTLKLLSEDSLEEVLIAQDADAYVTKQIEELAKEKRVRITYIESMKKLGRQCSISVGAAAAGIRKKV